MKLLLLLAVLPSCLSGIPCCVGNGPVLLPNTPSSCVSSTSGGAIPSRWAMQSCESGLSCLAYKCVISSASFSMTQYAQSCAIASQMSQYIQNSQSLIKSAGMSGECTSATGALLPSVAMALAAALLAIACA